MSQPTTARLGVPSVVGATSACNSTSTGRVPSMPANTAVPGLPRSRSERNNSEGLETSRRPRPVISNTPISSVGPKRFFIARRMRKCCEPSPSNDSTASTMCSTTRGPAIWPSFVTCPTRMIAAPVFLAKRIRACAEARTCVTVPGADSTVSVHIVWIESITIRRGTAPSDSVETMSSTEVSDGQLHRSVCKTEPLGAQPHLRHGLFAGYVDHAMAGAGHQAGGLRQQRRFADAGIAADQKHRAANKSAAGDAIELRHAGGQARSVLRLAGQRFQLERPALALRADRDRHRGRAGRVLLAQRIPLAAGIALALPAVIRRAAVLADEGEGGFGHERESRYPDRMGVRHSMSDTARRHDTILRYVPVELQNSSPTKGLSPLGTTGSGNQI